ncbi:MAG: methyltransferase domain-containing protein [Candidatus Daviesbacteria bacterium]|nr:methyltransferase domain-containing protein [Candidatus Daviesbacteria bacterium]
MNKISLYGNENFDKKYFGIYYKNYDQDELTIAYRWFKGWIRLMDQLYPIRKFLGKKVLVVGCGIGAFPKAVKEMGFDVQASDISKFIISKARKLQNDIDFRVEDIQRTTGKEEEYDLIFVIKTLERLKDPKQALKILKSRLKKEGVLVLSSPYPTKSTLADPSHINVKTPKEWVKLGKQVGFKKMKFQYVSFLPFLYRFHPFFSRAFPIKTDLPIVVNTCFFLFEN